MRIVTIRLQAIKYGLLGALAVMLLGGGGTFAYATVASHGSNVSTAISKGSCSTLIGSKFGACVSALANANSDTNTNNDNNSQDSHGDAVSTAAQGCAPGKGHGDCVEDVATNRSTLPSQALSATATGEKSGKGK
jgi:hypothetical protein